MKAYTLYLDQKRIAEIDPHQCCDERISGGFIAAIHLCGNKVTSTFQVLRCAAKEARSST